MQKEDDGYIPPAVGKANMVTCRDLFLAFKMRLLKDIYLVSGGSFGLGHFADCNVFMVDCGKELVLIDSGSGIDTNPLFENIAADGFNASNITHLMNTHIHYDHFGGDRKIQDLSNCEVMIHEKGAEIIEKGELWKIDSPSVVKLQAPRVTRKLKDSDAVTLGKYEFQIIHTPGHSEDSICILMEHQHGRILFGGDTIWPYGQPAVLSMKSDLQSYQRSVERISKRAIDVLLPGHWNFILSEASEHVAYLMTKLSGAWCDFVLYPPHPFFPRPQIERKLKAA